VDTNKNHKDWYDSIKKLVKNPEIITVLQENLHNTVKDTYSLNKVTESRRELYFTLVAKIKENKLQPLTI